jgi:hypothetical protein
MTPGNHRQEFGSLPNQPRHFHQPVKLSPHVVFTDDFGIDAAEAALGADGELFERKVACCRFTLLQLIDFKIRDVRIILDISGDKGKLMLDSSGCNYEI